MFYILSYLLFSIFSVFILTTLNSSVEANVIVLVAQVILFYLMYKKHTKKITNYTYNSNVVVNFDVNINHQNLFIKSGNWIFLVYVFVMSEFVVLEMMDFAYYISSTLNLLLMIYTVWPLIVESYYGFKQNNLFENILLVIGAIFLMYLVNIVYSIVLDYFGIVQNQSVNQQVIVELVNSNKLKLLFEITILAAISEELIFRGLAFRSILNNNRFLAYMTSFLAFGFPHLFLGFANGNGLSELIFLPLYGMMGVIFAYVYEKSNSIFVSMMAHFLNNLIAFFAIINL